MMLLTINVILVSFLFATLWAVNGATVPPYRIYPNELACSLRIICSSRCTALMHQQPINSELHMACSMKCESHHMGLARAMAARKGEIRVTYTAPDQYESNAAIPSLQHPNVMLGNDRI
ncbi:hypothetical protein F5887DRAFT_968478 [Amanita rubescens]|nr:hypothetical protein F5887DRAFT_968478 [Amanita rubescens]